MIRIAVKWISAIPVGDWPTITEIRTFDVDAPELEAFLRHLPDYNHKAIEGGHVIDPSPGASDREAGR